MLTLGEQSKPCAKPLSSVMFPVRRAPCTRACGARLAPLERRDSYYRHRARPDPQPVAQGAMKRPSEIKPPSGKLGVLLPGMGAVATTFVAGCILARRGMASPIGSLTQMGRIRLGKRTDNREPFDP